MAMQTTPTEYLRLSYSSLNTFESCARKLEFRKFYPQTPRSHFFAADVGTALHHGYQSWLAHESEELAFWELMKSYPYELEAQQDNDYRSLEACIITLEAMIRAEAMTGYELATILKPDGTEVPAIEVPFEIRFTDIILPDGRGLAFVGWLDAVARNLLTTRHHTLDIKTHRNFLKDPSGKYVFDDQQTPYGLVIEHITQESIEDFEILYLDTLVDLCEPRVRLYPFKRTKADVREWLLNKAMQFQRIQQHIRMDYWPRTGGGCMFYNQPCQFLDVCSSRDPASITSWLLNGQEPEEIVDDWEPWITTEIAIDAQ